MRTMSALILLKKGPNLGRTSGGTLEAQDILGFCGAVLLSFSA
jgi:hypothetical protein